jgi:Stress responsive A/B Barrel Domain
VVRVTVSLPDTACLEPVSSTMPRVLRRILMVRLKPGVTAQQVDPFMQAIESLPFPGRQNVVVGRDIGARPENMDLAVSNDFLDEATFEAWGGDPRHVMVRNELLGPIAERIERCLFFV